MKGLLLRQLQQATGVASPGHVNRLLASANAGTDCKPVVLLTGRHRRMVTGAEIMCPESNKSPKQQAQENKTSAISKPSVVSVDRATTPAAVEAEPNVVAMPVSGKGQKWWRPDPATGTWVPEGSEGQVTVTKSPSRVTRIRSDTTASLEDRRWWTSMEELPDMDRANPELRLSDWKGPRFNN